MSSKQSVADSLKIPMPNKMGGLLTEKGTYKYK
jgi:hypothetical protein